ALSVPIGKYGRCGSIIRLAWAGIVTEPLPYGQMPAMARNSVDLPAPEGPVKRTRSPAEMLKLLAATSGSPLGSSTNRSSMLMVSVVLEGASWMEDLLAASSSAFLMEVSKPSRRATTARQSASEV